MSTEMVMDLARQTMSTAFWVALPILAVGLVIGVLVAIFQAATQIQEASLAFIPKLVGVGAALLLFGGYILDRLTGFTVALISSFANFGGGQ
ncbi:MAG: flagellar biosynthetic protein FliQ [Deltaproteobacteria bacterium]|nr:flagellar biosynthetic protein FliQ [Deltaproteobacteria bacterium]